jgi:hypothetical protein
MPNKINLKEIEEKANRTSYYVFKRGEPLDSMDVEDLLHVVREMRNKIEKIVSFCPDKHTTTNVYAYVPIIILLEAKQALDLVEDE